MARTLYDIIGVPPSATHAEIEAACLRLGKQYSPENNVGDKIAAARFFQIDRAYDILTDSEKRSHYDRSLFFKNKKDSQITKADKNVPASSLANASSMTGDTVPTDVKPELSWMAKRSAGQRAADRKALRSHAPPIANEKDITEDSAAGGFWDDVTYGFVSPQMICPYCQVRGRVRTKSLDRKKGISGGKAVGGLFTGGLSLLATGLSRKEKVTQAHCENCTATWDF